MSDRLLMLVTFATAFVGFCGTVANAIVQMIHCRRDAREFAKRPPP